MHAYPNAPLKLFTLDDEVPDKWERDLNERLAEAWEDQIINETKDALPNADEYATKEEKLGDLIEEW